MQNEGTTEDPVEHLHKEIAELRQRVAELEERFAELEGRDDTTTTSSDLEGDGLDHRDERVLEYMAKTSKVSKHKLAKLYIHLTDITNRNTAKQRARVLERHPKYKDLES